MMVEAVGTQLRESDQPSIEAALRWMAIRRNARPLGLLTHAITDPSGDSAQQLAPLTEPTASMPGGTSETRALAVWGLIVQTIDSIGSTTDSRRRNTLFAAFRLPRRPEIAEPWRSSLNHRFEQLGALPGVFGDPAPQTTTPMHKAWKRALSERLVPILTEHLRALALDGLAWLPYVGVGQEIEDPLAQERTGQDSLDDPDIAVGYRAPSPGAQPVFANLFVTTVFMKGRVVRRRITERLVTAREDGVGSYMATALAGPVGDKEPLPVRALWGCHAEPVVLSPPGGPLITELRFPRTLQRGEQHFFASEAIDQSLIYERRGVNVAVDHHGISPGRTLWGQVPVSGLTIRIRFDDSCLPVACWWHGEQTERERLVQPPDGDPHLLTILGNTLQHTFTGKCHPRESYGISFTW